MWMNIRRYRGSLLKSSVLFSSQAGRAPTQFKDQVTMQVALVSPKHPSQSSVHQAELVSRRINRNNARHFKVPFQAWVCEWSNKSSRGTVDVNRNIYPSPHLQVIDCTLQGAWRSAHTFLRGMNTRRHTQAAHQGDIFVMSCVCASQNDNNPDGVLIDKGDGIVRIQDESMALLYGD